MSIQAGNAENNTFHFTTRDPAAKVLSFYEQGLKDAGLEIRMNTTGSSGGSTGGMITAEDTDKTRVAIVTVGGGDNGTEVTVMIQNKK
jgi:hypothetical protein